MAQETTWKITPLTDIESKSLKQEDLLLSGIQKVLQEFGVGKIDSVNSYTINGKIVVQGNVYFTDGTDLQTVTNVRQHIANFCEIYENGPYAFGVKKVVNIDDAK